MQIDLSSLSPQLAAAVERRIANKTTDLTSSTDSGTWSQALAGAASSSSPPLNANALLSQFYQLESTQAQTPQGAKIQGMSPEDAAITDLDATIDTASTPGQAAAQARAWAYSSPLVAVTDDQMPKNGDPASVWMAYAQQQNAEMHVATQMQDQRRALYDSESAEGVSGAQIYLDMLKQEAAQPQAALDTQAFPGQDLKAKLEIETGYLQDWMGSGSAND